MGSHRRLHGGPAIRNETGKSFAKIFAGTQAEQPVITLQSAKLESHVTKMGFASEWTYAATINLMQGNKVTALSVTATHTSTRTQGPKAGAKIVTEDAIADLANQFPSS